MTYAYNYLIGTLVLLLIWIIFFKFRKDLRKEMIVISLLFGIVGLMVDPIYSRDWWLALTATGTMPGIESFIFGFSTAGIASVAYSEIFKRKIRIRKTSEKEKIKRRFSLFGLLLLGAILFWGSFFLLNLNSFQATFPMAIIPTLIIWIKRKDLILNSIVSGVLIAIISFLFYLVPELINPGWLEIVWNFPILSGITLFGVVVEDIIWFFLAGLFIGPLYEYWQEGKEVDM